MVHTYYFTCKVYHFNVCTGQDRSTLATFLTLKLKFLKFEIFYQAVLSTIPRFDPIKKLEKWTK